MTTYIAVFGLRAAIYEIFRELSSLSTIYCFFLSFMNILYCDDDMDDVDTFTHAIQTIDSSIDCQIAFDGTEALDMLLVHQLKPDAIFIDLHMPKLDGREFVIAVKRNKELKDIPLIILSSSIEKKHVEQFNKMGVYYFLSKSAEERDLHAALKSILYCLPAHNCDDGNPFEMIFGSTTN
jgi:CheY-like chemotaxis protein